MSPRVVLVGPPGSGKSTVGRLLAQRLGVGFRDTDDDIEAATGMAIGDIFVEHGEAWFREVEALEVARALDEHDGVLALGGGAVLDAGTRARLATQTVVLLDVAADKAARRVGLHKPRPVLVGSFRGRWAELMRERRPLYAAVATVTVNTDDHDPDGVVTTIMATLAADGGAVPTKEPQ
jgi:shikimate kinase